MHQEKPSSLNPQDRPRPRSASTTDLIQNYTAQEQHTDGSGVSNNTLTSDLNSVQDAAFMLTTGYYPPMRSLPGLYGNFLDRDNMPPPQFVPPTSVTRHTLAPPSHSNSSTNQYDLPQASSSLHPGSLAFIDSRHGLLHPSDAITNTGNPTPGQQTQVPAVASYNSSLPEVELTEAEHVASDEKRRRNTAASARFRIKKKHRTIALERTVSDLTGRAEELEREVSDLRQENRWLKEIVMLKGSQNVANNRLALRQAVALATSQQSYSSESTVQADASEGSSSALSKDETPVKKVKQTLKTKKC